MVHSIADDWEQVAERFERLFAGLGDVSTDHFMLSFHSGPPSVATGISITRAGVLVASMPLHAIESVFTTIRFSEGLTALTLAGNGGTYTYTVPPALLVKRST